MLIENKNEVMKKLESILWEAASLIRGSVEASDYKKYILPLIFYKRLSEVFEDEVERLIEQGVATNKGEVYELLETEKAEFGKPISTRFVIPEEYLWKNVTNRALGLGEKITEAMRAIAKENPELSGVIDVVDFNETTGGERIISDEVLYNVARILNRLRLGIKDVEPDILGRAYEYMIRKFAEDSGQSAGEFYTPYEVGWLMVSLLNPEPGEKVYDPACGSGGLLIKSQLYVRDKGGDKPLQLFGQEKIPFTYAIARMNVIIHNMEADIQRGDTFTSPKFVEDGKIKKFDKVIANPPWNQDIPVEVFERDVYNRFSFGIPPGNTADWGWVQHMYASLEDTGKLVVIIDTGAVSRGSGSQERDREKEIRKKFVERDLIEAVILTPENLFYNTTAAGVILVINNNKPEERKGKILLINASNEFVKGTPKNIISKDSIEKITRVYENFEEIEKFSKIITIEEARKNDYNLSPSRYVSVFEEEQYRNVDEILEDLRVLSREEKEIDAELNEILVKLGFEGFLNSKAENT